jgi:hypothetical protein
MTERELFKPFFKVFRIETAQVASFFISLTYEH